MGRGGTQNVHDPPTSLPGVVPAGQGLRTALSAHYYLKNIAYTRDIGGVASDTVGRQTKNEAIGYSDK